MWWPCALPGRWGGVQVWLLGIIKVYEGLEKRKGCRPVGAAHVQEIPEGLTGANRAEGPGSLFLCGASCVSQSLALTGQLLLRHQFPHAVRSSVRGHALAVSSSLVSMCMIEAAVWQAR